MAGKRVVPRDEAVARVTAAADARCSSTSLALLPTVMRRPGILRLPSGTTDDDAKAAAALPRITATFIRDEGSDIVIVARTDARQAVSLEEALERVQVQLLLPEPYVVSSFANSALCIFLLRQ